MAILVKVINPVGDEVETLGVSWWLSAFSYWPLKPKIPRGHAHSKLITASSLYLEFVFETNIKYKIFIAR
jgi:hypothetical protein